MSIDPEIPRGDAFAEVIQLTTPSHHKETPAEPCLPTVPSHMAGVRRGSTSYCRTCWSSPKAAGLGFEDPFGSGGWF